jgi:hypothetical protein
MEMSTRRCPNISWYSSLLLHENHVGVGEAVDSSRNGDEYQQMPEHLLVLISISTCFSVGFVFVLFLSFPSLLILSHHGRFADQWKKEFCQASQTRPTKRS